MEDNPPARIDKDLQQPFKPIGRSVRWEVVKQPIKSIRNTVNSVNISSLANSNRKSFGQSSCLGCQLSAPPNQKN